MARQHLVQQQPTDRMSTEPAAGRWKQWLWPGFYDLWELGSIWALVEALGFAAAVNGLLLAQMTGSHVFSPMVLGAGWLLLALLWVGALIRRRRPGLGSDEGAGEDLFLQAQAEYLRGNWHGAQAHLDCRLASHPQDVEARLLLIAVLRRSHRWKLAEEQLERLDRIIGSVHWTQEIALERRNIQEALGRPVSGTVSTPRADNQNTADAA